MTRATDDASTQPRHCPICHADQTAPVWTKGRLQVVQCVRCTMRYATPVAQELVNGGFYHQLAEPFYLSPDKLAGDHAEVRFERERQIFRKYCHTGRVLDVGCSTGAFLHSVTRLFPGDYNVAGMDVAGPALDYAEKQGISVVRQAFLNATLAPSSFDAITFWAVLEHLADPGAFLAKAASLLRPGGYCFVLVPNLDSLAIRVLGQRYRYVMEEHLNYFTRQTLTLLASKISELKIVGVRSTHFNPVVLWQDWRSPKKRVADSERASLLRRTTRWKEKAGPARWVYSGLELLLGRMYLADNLVLVLRRI